MGSWTSFLNLFKPAKTDSYNVITQQDDNWDKIDAGVSALNSKMDIQTGTATAADEFVTINTQNITKSASVVCANFQAARTDAITSNAWTDFVVLPEGYRPSANLFTIGVDNTHDSPCCIQIKTNGTVSVYGASANSGMKSLKVGVSFI